MKVPKTMLDKYNVIAPIITEFCETYLNEEYGAMSLLMLEKLCRKRPSPVVSGKPYTWACGIVYAVGSVNFLFDKSQTPHMRAADLAEKFGISPSTAGNKAGEIKKKLNIGVFDTEWTLPSRYGSNPMMWTFETSSGFVFDARYAPREIQEELFEAGMIPFIPADRKGDAKAKAEDRDEAKAKDKDKIIPINADAQKQKSEKVNPEGQISFFDNSASGIDDDSQPVKQSRQPKQNRTSGSIIPLGSIEGYCANNQDYMRILKIYSDGYMRTFNKRKVPFRNELAIYLRRNFNTWYYSAANEFCPISPARFINSDINNKFGDGAVVFPVPRPVFNNNKVTGIEYSFRVFTLDDHPFILDMQLFLKAIRDLRNEKKRGVKYDSLFSFAITHFQDITENAEFTFAERPYIIVLCDVCERLNLISLTDARDGVSLNKGSIDAFFTLSGPEQLGRVTDILIERFVESFEGMKFSGMMPDEEDVLEALQEENEIEAFLGYMFDDMMNMLADEAQSLMDEGLDPYEMFESVDEKKIKALFEAQSIISLCCSHFFTVFGQYLQMILPEHVDPFVFAQTDDEYLVALENDKENAVNPFYKIQIGAMIYYVPPGGYGLTSLGADWFGIDLHGQEEELYPLVPPEYYQETFDGIIDA